MKELVGKFEAEALVFAKDALEAAGIEYLVRDDSAGSRYSVALGRMAAAPAMFDVLVESERLAEAKLAVERWQKEAEEAALRESGAPPPTPEELAADAEWEKEKNAEKQKEKERGWRPPLPMLLLGCGVIALLLWIITRR